MGCGVLDVGLRLEGQGLRVKGRERVPRRGGVEAFRVESVGLRVEG